MREENKQSIEKKWEMRERDEFYFLIFYKKQFIKNSLIDLKIENWKKERERKKNTYLYCFKIAIAIWNRNRKSNK